MGGLNVGFGLAWHGRSVSGGRIGMRRGEARQDEAAQFADCNKIERGVLSSA